MVTSGLKAEDGARPPRPRRQRHGSDSKERRRKAGRSRERPPAVDTNAVPEEALAPPPAREERESLAQALARRQEHLVSDVPARRGPPPSPFNTRSWHMTPPGPPPRRREQPPAADLRDSASSASETSFSRARRELSPSAAPPKWLQMQSTDAPGPAASSTGSWSSPESAKQEQRGPRRRQNGKSDEVRAALGLPPRGAKYRACAPQSPQATGPFAAHEFEEMYEDEDDEYKSFVKEALRNQHNEEWQAETERASVKKFGGELSQPWKQQQTGLLRLLLPLGCLVEIFGCWCCGHCLCGCPAKPPCL